MPVSTGYLAPRSRSLAQRTPQRAEHEQATDDARCEREWTPRLGLYDRDVDPYIDRPELLLDAPSRGIDLLLVIDVARDTERR